MKLIILVLFTIMVNSKQFYSISPAFQISLKITPDQLGHVIFQQSDQSIGWNKLHIYTSSKVTPLQQHQAAGFLQGYSTYMQIYNAFLNFAEMDFNGKQSAPQEVQNFLINQLAYMDKKVLQNPSDKFWIYVGYYLNQIRYMHAGYLARIKKQNRQDMNLNLSQIYYLPSIGDLQDLLLWNKDVPNQQKKNCNGYVKLINKQLFYTHGTHNRYPFMLRIFKTWSFPRQNVPLTKTTFSSRPGDMISKDDYYILDSGLRIMQTSLGNYIQDNIKQVSFNTAPSWIRTLVANHLSHNISEWIKYFKTQRSGTHNNQWVLIDPSQIQNRKQIIFFLQQAFSLTKLLDMTPILLDKGYVASYNVPISQQIYNKLGYTQDRDKTYLTESRALVLQKYHPLMNTIEDMKKWLITNQQSDISKGLAPRYDLLFNNSLAFGLVDCKIATQQTIKQNYIWAISGPSTSNGRFPPFDWRKWSNKKTPHHGLPQLYDFQWVKIPIDVQSSKIITEQ